MIIKSKIPIFIVVDTHTPEIKKLNVTLLPYAYYYVKILQTLERVVIIAEDDDVLEYAQKLGFKYTYKTKNQSGKYTLRYTGIYNHMMEFPTDYDWFIALRLDQPFKSENLILDAIRGIKWDLDFIVSTSKMTDRERLFINEDGKFIQLINNSNRNFEECVVTDMVDLSVLCIKTEFFKKCVESNDFYGTLWTGKFKTIKNDSMFIQILGHHHTERFEKVHNIFMEVQKLPKFGE